MDQITSQDIVSLVKSPLGIVAIFVSFIESAGVVLVLNTTGDVQSNLTYFVIFFPCLLLFGFFLIWWKKPHALYPPSAFGGEPNVSEFA
ncbi:MAG: hypothetical protein VST68_11985, partial [Nitrospirota bacterium]|nr:hypothetical protein [Nitrospirota bacterium]